MEIDTEKVIRASLYKGHIVKEWLNENWDIIPKLKKGTLAKELGVSRMHLYRLIEEIKAERK